MHLERSTPGRVFKSGNSLAVRIPRVIAVRMDVHEGTPIEMRLEENTLRIDRALTAHDVSLRDVLERITPENRHGEDFADLLESERW